MLFSLCFKKTQEEEEADKMFHTMAKFDLHSPKTVSFQDTKPSFVHSRFQETTGGADGEAWLFQVARTKPLSFNIQFDNLVFFSFKQTDGLTPI
jgi:hypothetical protein